MTSDGNHSYTFDAENRLVSVDNGQTATYVYSADSLRVRSTVGAIFMEYIHDLDGKTVGVLGANAVLIRQEFEGIATYSNAAYFHHRDWLGNLRATTDQTGAVKQTCTNLPFGDALTCSPTGITPEDFTGYMRDGETGLDFANARYYSSQFGRFLSVDPQGAHGPDPQSLNPYAYASNNPLSFTDPSGMDTCLWVDSPYGGSWDCSPSPGDSGSMGGPAGSPSMGGGIMSPFGCWVCFDFGGDSGPHLPGPPSMSALQSDKILGAPRSGLIMSGLGGLSSGAGIGVFKALSNPGTVIEGATQEVKFGFFQGLARGGRPRWVR